MTIQILQYGFIALIPGLSVIIILSFTHIVFYLSGRAMALNHLKKYHLKDIMDDSIKEISAKNESLEAENKRLTEQNTLLKDIVSGVRHLTRRAK